jgi:hypothetical protein
MAIAGPVLTLTTYGAHMNANISEFQMVGIQRSGSKSYRALITDSVTYVRADPVSRERVSLDEEEREAINRYEPLDQEQKSEILQGVRAGDL